MIVADTGAIVALVDADDHHHEAIRSLWASSGAAWRLPWAILAEVDYLLATHVGPRAEESFLADLAAGAFVVEWGNDGDLGRADQICRRHRSMRLGLVDATVMAVAERLRAEAIVTLDLRHFGSVSLRGQPPLLPRDL